MSMLGKAANSSVVHATNLAGMNKRLTDTLGPDGIRKVIEALINTAREMEDQQPCA